MKKFIIPCMLGVLLLWGGSLKTADAQDLHKKEVFSFLQAAFDRQVSLSNKVQTKEAMREELNDYFTASFTDRFIEANAVKVDGGYSIFGSDAAPYYVPFFSYDSKTKVTYDKDEERLYISEALPLYEEGPASESYTETITLEKTEGDEWKVSDIKYN